MERAAKAENLSPADAAWLHMEEPTNHFVVTSLLLLDERLELARLREAMHRRLPALPRLSQRVVEPAWPMAGARWEADPAFELDAHLHRVALPGAAGRVELEALVGDLIGQPLDLQRPPWQTYLIEDYEGGSAVITRLHHCLGDGSALVRMQLALTDARRNGWRTRRAPEAGGGGDGNGWMGALLGLAGDPGRTVGLVRSAAVGAATLVRLSLLDPDAPTPLRSAPGVMKRAAWSQPLPLAGVRRVARATGTTVNDVVVSAVAGGLGTYLRAGGQPVPRIRAMVPVDMRSRTGAVASGGNRFSLVLLELPVGVVDARERLMRVRIEMSRIKSSLEAQAGWVMVAGLGLLPAWLERPAARFFGDKATLVLTNVIGPSEKRYLGGSRIGSQTFWEPESGGLNLGVSIFSYAGAVVLGVVAGDRSVRRPGELVAAFEGAYADLEREAAPAR